MKHAKLFAILAVAAFCISAFAVAIDTEDSSADGEKLTYSFYIQLKDGSNTFNMRLGDVEVAGSEPASSLYKAALKEAIAAAGATITFKSETSNMITDITAGGHSYTKSGTSGTDPFYSFAVYKLVDKTWEESNLSDTTTFAIVFDKYEYTKPADESKYLHHDGGSGYSEYWTALPTVDIVDYKIFIDCKDSDGSSFSKWIYSTQMGISGNSLISARAQGAKAAGFTVNGSSTYATYILGVSADGHDYVSHGTYMGEDYYDFAAFCETSDGKWKDMTEADFDTATVVAHTFNLYKFTDPQDDSYYKMNMGYGDYWVKAPSQSPSGDDAKDNNLVLYIVIGAVAVVAVAVVAFFLFKKKA